MTNEERIRRQRAYDCLSDISDALDSVPYVTVLGEPYQGHGGSAYYRKLEEAQRLIDEVAESLARDLADRKPQYFPH